MIGAGGLREVPAMTTTPTPGIITDVGLRLGVPVALLATAAAGWWWSPPRAST